jgi:hypothetical protein
MRIHSFNWDFSSTAETVTGVLLIGAAFFAIFFI